MERLPFEIKRKILRPLPNQDKLTCLLVSKNWNWYVKPHVFSSTVIQNDSVLSKAITYFEKYPELASTALTLKIQRCQTALLYLPRIQQLFRNLKILHCSSDDMKLQCEDLPEKTVVLGTWNNLEELSTRESSILNRTSMAQLVLSNLCPELTKLNLEAHGLQPKDTTVLNMHYASIFNSMQNAPRLSHLVIKSLWGPLSILEDIHKAAPNLSSLQLFDLDLYVPGPIESVKSVQLANLRIQFQCPPAEYCINYFYDYVVKKYTGLTSFSITKRYINTYYDVFEEFPTAVLERTVLPLFTRCTQLTRYDQRFFPFTSTIANKMDQCRIQLKEIDLYVDQKTVKSQCTALVTSQQSQSLNHVFLHLVDSITELGNMHRLSDANIIPQAVELLANLSNMTSLTIESTSNNGICLLMFPKFLENTPNLLNLTLHGMVLTTTHDNMLSNLSLKTIKIHNLRVPSTSRATTVAMKSLLRICPDLEEFQLHMSPDDNPYNSLYKVTLDFSINLKLNSIEIDLRGNTNQYCIIRCNTLIMKHYLHDRVNNMWVEREYTVPDDSYAVIVLPQPVLLNSYKV